MAHITNPYHFHTHTNINNRFVLKADNTQKHPTDSISNSALVSGQAILVGGHTSGRGAQQLLTPDIDLMLPSPSSNGLVQAQSECSPCDVQLSILTSTDDGKV